MKKNVSGIILAAEIFGVILFHSLFPQTNDTQRTPQGLTIAPKAATKTKMALHAKPAYIYLPMMR